MSAPPRTAFLDRDGTINVKPPAGDYVKSWSEFRFLPGAIDAVRALKRAGWKVIVVTNQRGIARGLMTEEDLGDIHRRMLDAIGTLDGVYHCPHDYGQCECRKPAPGMLLRAATEVPGVDPAQAVMVGDSASDMQAGRTLGCRLVLIGDEPREEDVDHVAGSLSAAVGWLLAGMP